MNDKLYFDNKKVSRLQSETIEKISKGRDFLRASLKKIFDAVLDQSILGLKIFWKNSDGTYVNFAQHIIEKAHLYACDMYAEISDIAILSLTPIALMCSNENLLLKVNDLIPNEISADYEETLKKVAELFNRVKNNKSYTINDAYQKTLAYIDVFVADRIINRQAQELFDKVASYSPEDLIMIKNAYQFAKDAHNGVPRKSGIPYISHPLCVAKILADDKMEADIVAAALLHDVVEDTDYTLDDVANKTNVLVSNYVDAVTQIKNVAETKEDKEDADDETFQKLMAMTKPGKKKMEYALYIKAADRIHNLSTISCFPDQKQLKKVHETRTKYLRLFKERGMNRYSNLIENLCFMIEDEELYGRISNTYDALYCLNRDGITSIETSISKALGNIPEQCVFCYQDRVRFECEVIPEKLLPSQIVEIIDSPTTDLAKIERYINKHQLPLENIYVVIDGLTPDSNIRNFVSLFIKAHNDVQEFFDKTHIIKNIEFDSEQNHFIVYIQDKYKNNVKCLFMMRKDYNDYQNGFKNGTVEKPLYSVDDFAEQITVYTRDGDEMKLPKDSCAIDFAYRIHTNMGLSLYEVMINDKLATPTTILHNGNRIEIKSHTSKHVKRDDVPYEDYTIEVNWLNYVKTESAKKSITRFIQSELAKLKK